MSGGEVIPRNSLALWGRGGKFFDAFFWDGRVQHDGNKIISPFGKDIPSEDLLVTAVHLPLVEIREMLAENDTVTAYKTETVQSAQIIYEALTQNFLLNEPEIAFEISNVLNKTANEIRFIDLAELIATFIRTKFAVKSTKLHDFVFNEGILNSSEKNGAKLFYGKGKCSVCHSGPYLSDFSFHAIPFPSLGFGKNGFGIDYGRYNATHNPNDLYKFRTPPLLNVSRTAPYGHSGSVASLNEAVTYHSDPLRYIKEYVSDMDTHSRIELFKRMSITTMPQITISQLSDDEIEDIVSFLNTLTFN